MATDEKNLVLLPMIAQGFGGLFTFITTAIRRFVRSIRAITATITHERITYTLRVFALKITNWTAVQHLS